MRTAFVFPGQGSQKVGMGAEWAELWPRAAQLFARADETLGQSISSLCWHGPEDELQLTANTQPALLTVSIAIHGELAARGIEPVAMAGHSLGEYSALVAAGCLEFDDALRLVRRRGELMQAAVPVGVGAMAAVLGLDAEAVTAIAAEAAEEDVCAVANLNSPVQTVLAGSVAAIDRAVLLAREHGARRAVKLAVSAPFHSPLMAPAREGLTPMLEETAFAAPTVPVISNVDAQPLADGDAARDALRRQIDSPVRWVESIERMHRERGVERFVEVGSGAVLSGLIRRIVPGVETLTLSDPRNLEQLVAASDA